MAYILNSPASPSSGCISCAWRFVDSQVCPDILRIEFICGIVGLFPHSVSVDFAGRGKVGGNCGGTDEYVTFSNNPQTTSDPTYVYVDVWRALRDSVWTSSTSIRFYAAKNNPVVLSLYKARPSQYDAELLNTGGGIPDATAGCPTTTLRNIIVMDDGSLI